MCETRDERQAVGPGDERQETKYRRRETEDERREKGDGTGEGRQNTGDMYPTINFVSAPFNEQ